MSSPALVVIILTILAAGAVIVAAVGAQRKREKAKAKAFQQIAAELGLTYIDKAERDFRDAWTVLPQIPKQGDIHHVMYGEFDGTSVTFFRHRYVVSTGQATSVIVHWVFSTEIPNWPEIHIKKRTAIRILFGGRSEVSDDAHFNRDWSVKTDDKAFARALLSPRVRKLLSMPRPDRKKYRETWHIVGGKLCCSMRASINAETTRLQARRLLTMRATISGEHPESDGV